MWEECENLNQLGARTSNKHDGWLVLPPCATMRPPGWHAQLHTLAECGAPRRVTQRRPLPCSMRATSASNASLSLSAITTMFLHSPRKWHPQRCLWSPTGLDRAAGTCYGELANPGAPYCATCAQLRNACLPSVLLSPCPLAAIWRSSSGACRFQPSTKVWSVMASGMLPRLTALSCKRQLTAGFEAGAKEVGHHAETQLRVGQQASRRQLSSACSMHAHSPCTLPPRLGFEFLAYETY